MPVLTTETRLSEREAHDIMEYTRKYRTDYGIKVKTEYGDPDEVLGLKAHGEFCHIRHEGAL